MSKAEAHRFEASGAYRCGGRARGSSRCNTLCTEHRADTPGVPADMPCADMLSAAAGNVCRCAR